MNQNLSALQSLTRFVLENASKFEWTLQGFGMLRLHMPNNYRLHVWHNDFAVPNVSVIHDHLQWGLVSTVLFGGLENIIYDEGGVIAGQLYNGVILKPGVGTVFKSVPIKARLHVRSKTIYRPGESYAQMPEQIHESRPMINGTTTIMQKQPTNDDSARVYWPLNTEWVSAEPRPATVEEIFTITQAALKLANK